MRKSLVVIAMIGSMIVLAGCNTVAGLGQDLKKARSTSVMPLAKWVIR